MPEFEPTGLARLPLLLLHHVEEMDLDRHELMRTAGLSEEELQDPDARVPINKIWELWRIIIDRVPEPALGLRLGAAARIRELGVVGYAMYFSPNLRASLCRLARYSHIISKAVQYVLQHESDHARLLAEGNPRFDALRHPIDARLAVVVAAAREITASDLSPIAVHFPYERPVEIVAYQRFFRCPLEFDSPQAMLKFRNEDLDRSVTAGDENLITYLDRYADEVLQNLEDQSSLRDKVQRAIWSELAAGPPTLSRIASVLGISPRTLQRRLRETGTSFGALLDSFRRRMALRLLQDRSLAVYEIAFLLGYSDPSTFYRAFRRWQGAPPDEFRRAAS